MTQQVPIDEVQQLRALGRFLISRELIDLEQALGGFNLFRTLAISDKESIHSRMLAWLLCPDESHGLGDLFLRRWLMRVLTEGSAENVRAPLIAEVDGARWTEVEILTEAPLNSKRRIDIQAKLYLRTKPVEQCWWVIVEAKVESTQGDDQLDHYRNAIIKKAGENDRLLFIFLTRYLEKPLDNAWHSSSFQSVHTTLVECLKARAGNIAKGPGLLMGDYVRILEEQYMQESKVAEQVRSIFKAHPEAMAVIEANWPDPTAELNRFLYKQLSAHQEDLRIRVLPNRARDYFKFTVSSWPVDPNQPCVYGIIEVKKTSLGLRIFATPECPPEKKAALIRASKKDPFVKGKSNVKLNDDVDYPTLESGWTGPLPKDTNVEELQREAFQQVKKVLTSDKRMHHVFEEVALIMKSSSLEDQKEI